VSVTKLIREFSNRETVPIDIEAEVIPALRSLGVADEIYCFWDHNLDPKVLRGYVKHDTYPQPDGSSHSVIEVLYGKMGHEWERLVCCKELLHILDPDPIRCAKPEDVDRLIDKIILPPDLVDPVTDIGTLQAATDRLAVLQAVAILFPLAARKVLLPKYAEGRLTLADIEDLAEVPVRYVAMVMSAEWEEIHELLLDLEIPRGEPRTVPTPDRVSPLNPDGTIFEVHSVPIGVDAFTYARSLIERDRNDSQPPRSYMIDRKGVQSTHAAEEVIKLSSRQ
jgi:hypothetical protein